MPDSAPKPIVSSKTMIANAITIAVLLLGSPQFLAFLPPMDPAVIGSVIAFLNMVLRWFTVQPVSLTGGS